MRPAAALAIITALAAGTATLPAGAAGQATLNIVIVLDGLRPDAITPEVTPHLWQLRRDGVNFTASHSVFPTVTRVNATAIGSGTLPGRNGVVGNSQYVPVVDPSHAFVNDNHDTLLRLDRLTGGGMVLTKTLGEILREHGRTLAAVSSGSTGSALLTNARAPQGVGVLINGYFEPGVRVAFPDVVNDEIRRRFGPAPERAGPTQAQDGSVAWTQRVLRDYVLPDVRPDVIINWLTEPDHVAHAKGPGSPETRASIRNDDAEVGLLLKRLDDLGRLGSTNIIVVSDHGFNASAFGVNVTAELIKAGLKAGPDSDDVVLASSGETQLIHVKDRDRSRIHAITAFLQTREWTGVLFTAGRMDDGAVPIEGIEPGTFSTQLIHLDHAERGPDIVLTFPWRSEKDMFGMPGTAFTAARATGPLGGNTGNHGSMSPWTVHNTFLAWGVDFKRAAVVRTPVSNVDITPTLLALMGLDGDPGLPRFDGRVIAEAFAGGPDEEQVATTTTTHFTATSDGTFRTAIQVSEAGGERYLDKSWRVR
ncbi:MAG: alkaline phosphatase family protein [Bradyrhizobiaceae bacterium]|nr:alkaline phosphatase family protein [Bradyrhizobiaceae bacterium]